VIASFTNAVVLLRVLCDSLAFFAVKSFLLAPAQSI